MSKLFIEDTTLTAIADAIREKTGATGTSYEYLEYMEVYNAPGEVVMGDYEYNHYTFPGATSIKVKCVGLAKDYGTWTTGLGYCTISEGAITSGGTNATTISSGATYSYSGDSFTVYYSGRIKSLAYRLYVYGYDADGNAIEYAQEVEGVPATYTPLEMPNAILGITGGDGITPTGEIEIVENGDFDVTEYANAHVEVPVGVFPSGDLAISANGTHEVTNYETVTISIPTGITPEGTLEITENGTHDVTNYASALVNIASSGGSDIGTITFTYGELASGLMGKSGSIVLEQFGNNIETANISNLNTSFKDNTATSIPFAINTIQSTNLNMEYTFQNCYYLKKAPAMVCPEGTKSLNYRYLFSNCYELEDISEVANYPFASGNSGMIFNNCRKLRSIPEEVNANMGCYITNNYTYSYAHTYALINCCWTLEECLGVMPPNNGVTNTNNMFTSMAADCYRLSRFTFAVQEDGTPYSRPLYTNQTIDLSSYVGWCSSSYVSSIIGYGVTMDDRVYSDETYAARKDLPNMWTDNWCYSRYNHDSALETIQSLPDCSASGATNTIKFKGEAGLYTDGGAINTLTDEEIAIATAKGWTVTLV